MTESNIRKEQYTVTLGSLAQIDTSSNKRPNEEFRVHRSIVRISNIANDRAISSLNSALRSKVIGGITGSIISNK
jgi:hypothetical protein